ncbi:MAG: M20/M25/M40 family metallo-hydrolase [Breznakibacter sp.]
MKPANLFVILLFILPIAVFGQDVDIPEKALKHIRERDLRSTMSVLTSERLEGRATGQPGADKAADYIAGRFSKLGLQPFENGSYFQTFNMWGTQYGMAEILVNGNRIVGDTALFNIGTVAQNNKITRQLVFVGNANDSLLARMDLQDKVVLAMFGNLNRRLSLVSKLQKKGVFAVIGFNPDNDAQYDEAKNGALKLRSYASLSMRKPIIQEEGLKMVILNNTQLPVLIGKSASELKLLADQVDPSLPLGATIEMILPMHEENAVAKNVIGVLKGSDVDAKPIAVTAHYDHVGRQPDGSVCLGADDNASGVSVVLEVAESFTKLKEKPSHDIYFIAFTAEELGLYGSAYFMKDRKRDDFFANINIDMIGRQDTLTKDNYVYILGTDKKPWAHELHQKANAKTVNLKLDYHYNQSTGMGSYMNRSDHFHFYKLGIPVISFFSGLHDDYHTPRDTMDKINFPLMTQRAKLVFATLYMLDNYNGPLN